MSSLLSVETDDFAHSVGRGWLRELGLRGLMFVLMVFPGFCELSAQEAGDPLRSAQLKAIEEGKADWAHWGVRPEKYTDWSNHSNRLVPVYLFGGNLQAYAGANSPYRSAERMEIIYGYVPEGSHNPEAEYFDQTDIYHIQRDAFAAGKKHVILMVFDGMDWQTTQAAAIYRTGSLTYQSGRGSGLSFQDYQANGLTDFGACVTSAHCGSTKVDVDRQLVLEHKDEQGGGYSAELGGAFPWSEPPNPNYLLGKAVGLRNVVTDSAGSATSLCSGIKTYNAAINVGMDGQPVEPIARQMQRQGFRIGVVTSVPISHATPASAYANNVDRNDYQDLSRDLLGLPSTSHPQPLPGVDVLIGAGWGESRDDDFKNQGLNFVPGNRYLPSDEIDSLRIANGGPYRVVERTAGVSGGQQLMTEAKEAARSGSRLFGFFGVGGGHLPYQTADGKYDPTRGKSSAERYSPEDITENPTLAEMTTAALTVLGHDNPKGFWLMIEPGDVDWANHNNNLDDSIGAVFSGAEAFTAVTDWVEQYSNWDETLVIVTADHGHFLVLDQPDFVAHSSPSAVGRKAESEPAQSSGN